MLRKSLAFCVAVLLSTPIAGSPAGAPAGPTECDLLAGHPSDPDKVGAGVPTAQVRAWNDAAIDACRRDVAASPGDARLRYNLGRALFYRGRSTEAIEQIEIAAARQHRQAQFVLGLLHADGVPDVLPSEPCRALPLWADAARRGHYAAQVSVARDWLRGRYDACAGKPSRDEIGGFLTAAAQAKSDYYQGLLLADLRERFDATR
jgi:TPR repeat protein